MVNEDLHGSVMNLYKLKLNHRIKADKETFIVLAALNVIHAFVENNTEIDVDRNSFNIRTCGL
jgi:hypothetical protein